MIGAKIWNKVGPVELVELTFYNSDVEILPGGVRPAPPPGLPVAPPPVHPLPGSRSSPHTSHPPDSGSS